MNEKDKRILIKIFYGMKVLPSKIFNSAQILDYFRMETNKTHKMKQR